MSIFSSLFGWITSLLAKIWNLLKKILPIILLACAIYFGLGFSIAAGWLFAGSPLISGAGAALLSLGASFLIAPGETAEVLGKAVTAAADVASDVAVGLADVVSSGLGAFFSSPAALALGAGAALWFFMRNKKEDVGLPKVSRDSTGSAVIGYSEEEEPAWQGK